VDTWLSQRRKGEKGGHRDDVTTKGNSNWKKFKGTCRKCGKIGHKGLDCRSDGGKMKGKCFGCGQEGHYKRDCHKKEEKKADETSTGTFVGMLWWRTIKEQESEDEEVKDEEVEKFLAD
jgi:hypothetical protein